MMSRQLMSNVSSPTDMSLQGTSNEVFSKSGKNYVDRSKSTKTEALNLSTCPSQPLNMPNHLSNQNPSPTLKRRAPNATSDNDYKHKVYKNNNSHNNKPLLQHLTNPVPQQGNATIMQNIHYSSNQSHHSRVQPLSSAEEINFGPRDIPVMQHSSNSSTLPTQTGGPSGIQMFPKNAPVAFQDSIGRWIQADTSMLSHEQISQYQRYLMFVQKMQLMCDTTSYENNQMTQGYISQNLGNNASTLQMPSVDTIQLNTNSLNQQYIHSSTISVSEPKERMTVNNAVPSTSFATANVMQNVPNAEYISRKPLEVGVIRQTPQSIQRSITTAAANHSNVKSTSFSCAKVILSKLPDNYSLTTREQKLPSNLGVEGIRKIVSCSNKDASSIEDPEHIAEQQLKNLAEKVGLPTKRNSSAKEEQRNNANDRRHSSTGNEIANKSSATIEQNPQLSNEFAVAQSKETENLCGELKSSVFEDMELLFSRIPTEFTELNSIFQEALQLFERHAEFLLNKNAIASTPKEIEGKPIDTITNGHDNKDNNKDTHVEDHKALQGKSNLRRPRQFILPPEYDPNDSKWTLKHRNASSGIVELTKYSGIYIDSIQLMDCKRISKNYAQFARNLMAEIFSESALGVCSLTGAKANAFKNIQVRPGLDKHARNVILNYVKAYGRKVGWGRYKEELVLNTLRSKIQDCRRIHNKRMGAKKLD